MKDTQAAGDTFSPQKRPSSTSNHENALFSIIVGHFCPLLDPEPADQKPNTDPDPQH